METKTELIGAGTIAVIVLGVAGYMIFKKEIAPTVSGVGDAAVTAAQGAAQIPQAIGLLAGGTSQALNTVTERTSEVFREVTSPTQIIQSGSQYATTAIDDATKRLKTVDEARLKSQSTVGSYQGQADIIKAQETTARVRISETAKTGALKTIIETGKNIACSLPVVKDTSVCKSKTVTAAPIAPKVSTPLSAILTPTSNLKSSSVKKVTAAPVAPTQNRSVDPQKLLSNLANTAKSLSSKLKSSTSSKLKK